MRLRGWLEMLVGKSGSDLFLVEGLPPTIRAAGKMQQVDEVALTGKEIEAAILPALIPRLANDYRNGASSVDSSLQFRPLGRFRLNLHRERGRPAATIRALPARPPRLSELGLPD